MKKIKGWKHQKEFDTKTLISEIEPISTNTSDNNEGSSDNKDASKETRKAVDLKTISDAEIEPSNNKTTQIYEPRPLTPDDDIYEDIIEQFASAPTKPKYWFEEFGDYWSCSCGHINKGDQCKSCGLERELLRSLFILHKPAGSPGKLNKKLNKAAKAQVDKEEELQTSKENRRKQREAAGDDILSVIPIETDDSQMLSEPPADEISETESADNIDINDDEIETTKEENITGSHIDSDNENKDSAETELSDKTAVISQNTVAIKQKKFNIPIKLIIAIVACLILIGSCGAAIYYYMAAPAMQYEEAQQLQADGEYKKAIEKYKSLGDYKNCDELIWQCYIGIGDRYFDKGEFNKAIDTYNIAIDLKDDESLHDKIWKSYYRIGDRHMDNGEYEKALSTYYVAADLKDNKKIQGKINSAKFSYVKQYQNDRTAKVEEYMSDLMSVKYSGIQEIYDNYYAWHVKIIANTSAEDYSTDVDTISRKDTAYFHAMLSGGEPSEQIMLYYEIIWPNGDSQIYNLDSTWQAGSKITARFQYPIPLFGKEGNLTFKLYDKNTNEMLGSDKITFKH